MVSNFFDKKASSSGIEYIPAKELAEELQKPVIRNFNKGKVHSPFIDNISGADIADMQLISNFNKGIWFLMCVIYRIWLFVWHL